MRENKMFSVETRVNGELIGHVYVHNEELPVIDGKDSYYVEYHRFGKNLKILNFRILHKREEGIEKLISMIYRKIEQEIKK